MSKLSTQLMDAYMIGDQNLIGDIKAKISRFHNEAQKKNTTDPIKVNTILNDEKSSAIAVYDFLTKTLGKDWWELEFETIERLLWINYGFAFEDINRDKVQAIKSVCHSDTAFSDWYIFNQVALSFGGVIADFMMLRSPSPGMVIAAVKALNHIRPDREGVFDDEVVSYICVLFINAGIYTPPPSIASLMAKKMKSMVSEDTSKLWGEIYSKIGEVVNGQKKTISENTVDIQAARVLRAEAVSV